MPIYPFSQVQQSYFISQLQAMAMDRPMEIWAPVETTTSGGVTQVFSKQSTANAFATTTQRREMEDAQSGAITTTSIWQFAFLRGTVIHENYQLRCINDIGQSEVYEVKATWVSVSNPLWIVVEAIKRN